MDRAVPILLPGISRYRSVFFGRQVAGGSFRQRTALV
jgi:hypothetical protein